MFDNAFVVATQVFIMFLLVGVGFVIRKLRLLDDSSLRQINNLLLLIINPCVIINAFQSSFDRALLPGMAVAFVAAIVTHVVGAALARLVFRKSQHDQRGVLQFAVVFSNCAFMCIPLLDALLGSDGVMYGSIYFAVFNVWCWTYGVMLMTRSRKGVNLRQALLNPGTISILVALPLFLLAIRLPAIPLQVIGYLAGMNTPLAMLLIGAQMAMFPFVSMFRRKSVYVAAAFRLLIVPAIMLALLSLFDLDRTVLLSCLIPAMAPTAAAATLFATRFEQDAALATRTVALTTLLSIATMPLMIFFSDLIKTIQ